MFERYTDRARRIIFFARYDASALASSSIDTEHLPLGLLREGAGIAGKPSNETSLPTSCYGSRRRAAHHVSAFHQEAIRVEVALPEEKWVVTIFPDGRVAVEVFSASGAVDDESALARLLDRLGPPKNR
jgi:hypothetical protein